MTAAIQAHSAGLDRRLGGAGTGDGSSAANAGASALSIKQLTGTVASGVYWVKPPNGTAQQVYCDMTLDGGGWMLVARSHPNGNLVVNPGQWGWKGTGFGSPSDYTNPYCLPYYTEWYQKGFFASELIYGNRLNVNNSRWGPFVYKRYGGTDNLISWIMLNNNGYVPSAVLLKADATVFNYGGLPSMQGIMGWIDSGTANLEFTMRDVNGTGYGLRPEGLLTTYINDATLWQIAGPWGRQGNETDGSGNFLQTTGNDHYGGTWQAMLMVR